MSSKTHRTSAYFDSPDLKVKSAKTPPPEPQLPEPQPVPVGPVAKLVALSEAYFEALQLLRTHLKHPDAKLASRAAMKIMDLQLATIRHKTNVLGTTLPDDVRPFEIPDELVSSQYGEAAERRPPRAGRVHLVVGGAVRVRPPPRVLADPLPAPAARPHSPTPETPAGVAIARNAE
jgi:hypothetical protein